MEFHAALNGKKINIPRVGVTEERSKSDSRDVTPEQDAAMKKRLKESLEKKIQERASK